MVSLRRSIRPVLVALLLAGATGPARACELALLFAVDVSGSVGPGDYRIQMDGLAAALADRQIAAALVEAQAAVMVMQWSGTSRQRVSVPWRRIGSRADVAALATEIALVPREWRDYSTAIGEALRVAAAQFADVPDCPQRIIDISGDGTSNEGADPLAIRPLLLVGGITVNALVIEENEAGLVDYFRASVIFGPGAFALAAARFADYPERMRQKLAREIAEQVAALDAIAPSVRDRGPHDPRQMVLPKTAPTP